MANQKNKKAIMVVLDGWGIDKPSSGNAIARARTPTIDTIERKYKKLLLQASGIAVGLPWGQEGNSEVGHMNLGAGRIVYQYLPRITTAIRDGSFFKNDALAGAAKFAEKNNSTLHLMGLVSSGSVHSYIDHVYGLLELANRYGIEDVVLHVFTDGKDSTPKEAISIIDKLKERMEKLGGAKIGTIIGRAYAMDRNNRWELTQKTYELLTHGSGEQIEDPEKYLQRQYEKGNTDFDIEPAVVYKEGEPAGLVKENDALVFFNFREDSARQITKAFVAPDEEFDHFARKKIDNLYFVGMTQYEEDLSINVAFPPPDIQTPLAKAFSDAGKTQLHIAETEKYAHVTYFFNGQREDPFQKEEHTLVPSLSTTHYEDSPEMQAPEITEKIIEGIDSYDFIVANYANADMISHTGDLQATIRGVEAIDTQIKALMEEAYKREAALIITSDHGHAERMRHPKTGKITTTHSNNPVPLYIVDPKYEGAGSSTPLYEEKPKGVLADVAPTILNHVGIDIPPEMSGNILE